MWKNVYYYKNIIDKHMVVLLLEGRSYTFLPLAEGRYHDAPGTHIGLTPFYERHDDCVGCSCLDVVTLSIIKSCWTYFDSYM